MTILNWFLRRGRPDPEALFARLAEAHSAGYSDAERYRDFRQVFLGSDQGRKVLYEIFSWANMFRPAFIPGDPYATHYRDGERNIGLRILAVLNAEPASERVQAEPDPTELEI